MMLFIDRVYVTNDTVCRVGVNIDAVAQIEPWEASNPAKGTRFVLKVSDQYNKPKIIYTHETVQSIESRIEQLREADAP
jgi:hypothetical protein